MNQTTYSAKASASRAAKKAHGDDWATICKVVAVGDRFAIEVLRIHDDSEATRMQMVEELKAGIEAINKPAVKAKPKATVTVLVPLAANPNATGPTKSVGRPISELQVKVRRRLVEYIRKQGAGNFGVKEATKTLKLKKMHVSNAFRWCEHQGYIERLGFKPTAEKRPGRKDVMYKTVSLPVPVAEAA